MKLKVSALQMDMVHKDQEANRRLAAEMMAEAMEAEPGTDMLVLPETWTTGYSAEVFADTRRYAETVDGPSVTLLREFARTHGVWIVGGSMCELDGEDVYNTIFLINRQGEIVGRYRKMHLYSDMDEDKGFRHGEEMPVFDTEFGKLALMTCYDIRFVELSRTYAVDGAQLIVTVSNFPNPKLHHWRCLLQARAIENQLCVVACNRVGAAGPSTYFGHSIVIDAWGEIIAESGDEACILPAELDLDGVAQVRAKIPMYYDRRPMSYPDHILRPRDA